MFKLILLLNLINLIKSIDNIEINNFLPFGPENNDKIFEHNLNDITDPIYLSVKYPFFNKYYDEIRLSLHGLIIFGNNTFDLSILNNPKEFPIENLTCIAPYWINTNIKNDQISQIYYREILLKNEIDTLYEITKILQNGFPKLASERMIWAFIITYYEISSNNNNNLNRNTYQFILTTNGYYSFSLVNYYKLDWSIDLFGNQPQIGFNAGDNLNYYKFKKTSTDLIKESNTGIQGQYIFHSTGNITDVQCETSTGLQITPFRGSIYGGYEIRLYGICFNQTNYKIEIDNQIINDCRLLNSLYIICTMPMIMDSGKFQIKLFNNDNNTFIDSTDFLAHVPEDNGELILKNYFNLTQQIVDPNNNELILQFQSNSITRKYLFRIIIYDYATQLSTDDNQTLYNRTRQRIDLGLGYLNLSKINNLTIGYDKIFSVKNDPNDRVHALQISFEIKKKSAWFRSALFIGAKIFTAAASLNSVYCPAWLLLQRDPKKYLQQIPVCACQIPTKPWPDEFMGFRMDESCDGRKPIDETCAFHKKARSCYRKRSDTSWSGAQCCYDEQGLFIEQGKEGAGTLDVISPDANSWFKKSLSMFGHFFSDFLSYWSCCRSLLISEKMCQAYYKYRPAGECQHFEIESIEKYNSPDLITLNGISYRFYGQGEYTLLTIPNLNQQHIQIRFQSNEDNTSIGISAFVISLFNGNKRIQFELFQKHKLLEIRINSKLIDLPDEEFLVPIIIYEDEHVKIKRKINGEFTISLNGIPFRFSVQIQPTFQFFDFQTLIEKDKFTKLSIPSYGLLGDLNGLIYPNGTRLTIDETTDENILYDFGQSWHVSKNNSLFYYLFDDINSFKFNSKQQICNDYTSQQDQQYCTQSISNIDTQLLDETNTHSLYQYDQFHWESLTVTIPSDIISQLKPNNAFKLTFSFITLLVLLTYSFIFINILFLER